MAVAAILWSRIDSVRNPLKSDRWFTQQQLNVITYKLHDGDLGIVDVNNDNRLDIFTVNHSARQSLLVNDASEGFTDRLLQLNLAQKPEFPGMTFGYRQPPIEAPGLYIYFDKTDLVIQTHDIGDIDSVTGQILQLPKSKFPKIETKGNLKIFTSEKDEKLNVEFVAQGDSQLIINFLYFYSSPSFELNKQLPLDRIYVGPKLIQPSSHKFKIPGGKDRHGMVWADYNGDEKLDVFIVRGAQAGTMKQDSPNNKDELMIQNNFVFKNRTAESGILKNICSARQAGSVDFDNDGQLDIYVACAREKPNQLHWKKPGGRFVDVAAERGLDIPENGAFLWLDADNDGDMDLFWASHNKEFWLYVNRSGHFEPQLVGQSRGRVSQLTVSDYDSDGDLDVFAASTKENALLSNVNGTYEIKNPQSVGLPAQAYAANWADYDNDGLMDLHVLPDGIYRQRSDRRFEAIHLLKSKDFNSKVFSDIFCIWFDADNDGSRDLLIAMEDRPFGWMPYKLIRIVERIFSRDPEFYSAPKWKVNNKWKLMLYRNIGIKNHWLQVQLTGKEGNRQAIGARVEVATPDGVQLQQVGQAEGSKFSQGHYRLYFGLGQYESADSVKIFWPDGTLKEIENLKGDRLVEIKYST